jgi:hypothetical protein
VLTWQSSDSNHGHWAGRKDGAEGPALLPLTSLFGGTEAAATAVFATHYMGYAVTAAGQWWVPTAPRHHLVSVVAR